jgi:DNA-binding MarR family transcriptional regulator
VAAHATVDFFTRLRRIDNHDLKVRDIVILWAIAREPGMMGNEIAAKLGYKSRSNVKICIARLEREGYIEDRRPAINRSTPNDLHITPAGNVLLAEIVPT